MRNTWGQVREQLRKFAHARRGNVAVTFALATLPIIGGVGAAVDYSHANSVKVALQAALDSTALMLSRDATTVSAADLQTKATNYFNALFVAPQATNTTITASYTTTGGSSVVVNGSTTVPTAIMGIIGYNAITINGSATAKWGSTRLRVALALDNTGSMAADGKMTALKSATKNLLTQLRTAATNNGDVYVSIVPFSKDVNVGSNNHDADWIDWDDWEDTNGSWQTTTSCTAKSKRGKSRCKSSQTWVPASRTTWNGCITDRDRDYDQLVTSPNPADATLPVGQASTLFPAEQYGSCPKKMMGLNYDWNAMNNLVDQMTPAGNTNQPIGLVWAWQSLVGGAGLTAPAKEANYNYQEIIILMSDGLNTENRWYQTQTPIDNRMYQTGNGSGTCANIKASGVTIYAIHVNTNGDPMSTLMRNCASGTDKFWMITSAEDLNNVFKTIGTNLTQLRVAK